MSNIKLAEWVATVGNIGRIPGAPGTWGSLAAVLAWLILPQSVIEWPLFIGLAIILFFIGVWSATKVEDFHRSNDPGYIIVDEWVGQWFALIALPQNWLIGLIAFLFFRAFDILKPWPINRLQTLPKGWGVMTDDLLAGIYALGVTHLIKFIWL